MPHAHLYFLNNEFNTGTKPERIFILNKAWGLQSEKRSTLDMVEQMGLI